MLSVKGQTCLCMGLAFRASVAWLIAWYASAIQISKAWSRTQIILRSDVAWDSGCSLPAKNHKMILKWHGCGLYCILYFLSIVRRGKKGQGSEQETKLLTSMYSISNVHMSTFLREPCIFSQRSN